MYINTQTMTQHSEQDIRSLNPNTSFGNPFVAPEEYAIVFPTPQSVLSNPVTKHWQEVAPVLTAKGHWEQVWSEVDAYSEFTDAEGVIHTKEEQESIAIETASILKLKILQDSVITQIQARLDNFAKTRNYDSILSACTYATSTVTKFAVEGQYCVSIRDATWAKAYEILDSIKLGTLPSDLGYDSVEALLPVLVWPN